MIRDLSLVSSDIEVGCLTNGRRGWWAECRIEGCDWRTTSDLMRPGLHLDQLLEHLDEDHSDRGAHVRRGREDSLSA